MITSAKKYTKKKTDRQNPGQMVKTNLYRQKSHKEAYKYTLTKREKGKKYIYKKKEDSNKINKQIYQ